VWELKFGSLGGQGARQIATEKAKHDTDYQARVGIVDGPAKDLAPDVTARIQRASKTLAVADLASHTGDRVKVRYMESGGQKQAQSVTLSSAAVVKKTAKK